MPCRIWVPLLVFAALLGCSKSETSPEKPPEKFVMLKVGHVGHDHQLALYLAALEGERFRKEFGIYLRTVKPREVYDLVEGEKTLARLDFVKVGGGAKMPAAMSRGEICIGLGGVAAVAKFADESKPFKIICPLQTDGDMLVMKNDSPVTDWDSFVASARSRSKPLMIGYKAPVAVAKLVFVGALKAENLSFSYDASDRKARIVLVNMMSEKSPLPLLASGSIDGFVMNQPAVAVAVHKKLGKVVAELRNLPPKGKWVDHPCCCVSATTETIEKHPEIVKAFLKIIHLSTQIINEDQALAIDCASRWTKNPREVEADSIPTIHYIAEPTVSWVNGMKTWVGLMQEVGAFNGRYSRISADEFVKDVCDLKLCRQAADELRAKGLLKTR